MLFQKPTGSSCQNVFALNEGCSALVGGHTEVLKDEGTVQEEEVIGIWAEWGGEVHAKSCIGSSSECRANVDQRALY